MTYVKKIHGLDGKGFGPKWNDRKYPHPYSAENDDVGVSNLRRVKKCAENKLCITCGEYVKGDLVGLVLYNPDNKIRPRPELDWLNNESGPLHLDCMNITFKLCPHLAETDMFMPGVAVWKDVKRHILALSR